MLSDLHATYQGSSFELVIISHHTLLSEGLDVVTVATLICFDLLRGKQLSVSNFLFICVWRK